MVPSRPWWWRANQAGCPIARRQRRNRTLNQPGNGCPLILTNPKSPVTPRPSSPTTIRPAWRPATRGRWDIGKAWQDLTHEEKARAVAEYNRTLSALRTLEDVAQEIEETDNVGLGMGG